MGNATSQRAGIFSLGGTPVHSTASHPVLLSSFSPPPAVPLGGRQTTGIPFPSAPACCTLKDFCLSVFLFSRLASPKFGVAEVFCLFVGFFICLVVLGFLGVVLLLVLFGWLVSWVFFILTGLNTTSHFCIPSQLFSNCQHLSGSTLLFWTYYASWAPY